MRVNGCRVTGNPSIIRKVRVADDSPSGRPIRGCGDIGDFSLAAVAKRQSGAYDLQR